MTKAELEKKVKELLIQRNMHFNQERKTAEFIKEQVRRLNVIGVRIGSWRDTPNTSLNTAIGNIESWAKGKNTKIMDLTHQLSILGEIIKDQNDETTRLKAEFYDKMMEK